MDILIDMTPLETDTRFHGIGYYITSIGKALMALSESERQGFCIAGLGSRAHSPNPITKSTKHLAVVPLDFQGHPDPAYGRSEWYLRHWAELVLLLRTQKPRLFHMTQPFGVPRGSGVPRIFTCHDILPLVLPHQYLHGSFLNLKPHIRRLGDFARYQGAKRVIAISRHTADDLIRLLHVPGHRIDVVPHGVDHDRFKPPASPEEEAADEACRAQLAVNKTPYFLFLGAADPRKRGDLLISAFADAKLDGVELVFAGRLAPSHRKSLDEALEQAGRPSSVRFLGFVPDDALVPLIRGALALVYPSTYEGFGLPVLEAMASGCPVVTTHATSLGEVAGDAALMAPPGEHEGLREALRQIALEPGLRAELKQKGLRRAAQFSWRETARQTIDCYKRALE